MITFCCLHKTLWFKYHVWVMYFYHFNAILICVNLSATLLFFFLSVRRDQSLANGWLFGWKAGGRIKGKNMGKIICKQADVMQYRPVLWRWGLVWWQRASEHLPVLPGCCSARCLWSQCTCQRAAEHQPQTYWKSGTVLVFIYNWTHM